MKKLFFILLNLAFTSIVVVAQQSDSPVVKTQDSPYFGIYLGGQLNNHSGSFGELPGTQNCCTEFKTGSGFSPYFGLLYDLPLAPQWKIQVRGGYNNFKGIFREQEFIGNALSGSGSNAKVVEATSEHYLEISLGGIDASAQVSYFPIKHVPLGIDLGMHGVFMLSPSFIQHEDLIAPNSTIYSDSKSSQRNFQNGNLDNSKGIMAALGIGLHYDILLSNNWKIAPEASFLLPFGSPIDFTAASMPNATWSLYSIRFGVSLAYTPDIPSSIGKNNLRKPYKLKASVIAKQILKNNTETDIAKMTVEETLSKQLYPLLPYIFFDEGESTIPIRYKNLRKDQTSQFNVDKQFLFTNTTADDIATVNMDVYYHLLNIVGYRMKAYPGALITLVGCNRNSGSETGDTALSRQRAQSAKDYLVQNWGIQPQRISLKVQNLPSLASSTSVDAEDGHTENRRVEIESSIPEIIEPLVVRDTLREANPPVIRYRMNVENENPIQDWTLTAKQPALLVVNQSGIGTPPEYYDFNTIKRYKNIPRDSTDIPYTFTVHDVRDSMSTASGVMPVEQLTIQKKKINRVGNLDVNKYRIIMFDFNSDILNSAQNRIIEKYIREDLKSNSLVEVVGHTDRKGNDVSNQALSENRASNVASTISTGKIKTKGVGESNPTYSNELPEGRMYNRTVEITVSNPIE
ncbi:MAG: OmpA family protein [Bacteroidetes bacterium]|nr:OmpA family protein [Bacteroidota bacterium]